MIAGGLAYSALKRSNVGLEFFRFGRSRNTDIGAGQQGFNGQWRARLGQYDDAHPCTVAQAAQLFDDGNAAFGRKVESNDENVDWPVQQRQIKSAAVSHSFHLPTLALERA